ncbi:HAD family hydrolase [Aliikangiella sp. G2MR2-5]|uniref:HAD family hydrolase n=1 Tax=Aliikangiella sp. G2MR2-5 TaxID=2788943 RepID=UPI0018ABD3ED|nr:HAD-IA family hydrolase [Aliikangiella sp. G2MR2-5]
MPYSAVLFDLDGTLVDTALDLGNALNYLLIKSGREPLADKSIRPFVSGGTPALIKLGFGYEMEDPEFPSLKQAFLDYYEQNLCRYSKPFNGILDALTFLETNEIQWGIVTNKPDYLTKPLLEVLNLSHRSAVTISGDTYDRKKPDPFPLLQACKIINVKPQHTFYIGDDHRDIVAAQAAEMLSVSVGWGYPGEKNPLDWQAKYHLNASSDLQPFLKSLL